jgi:hypothetical protein
MVNYVSFTSEVYEISESGEWQNERVGVERTGDLTGAVTCRISVSSVSKYAHSATKNVDFTMPSQLLSWNDGEGGIKYPSLLILQDNQLEDTEIFALSISKPTNSEIGTIKKCTISIIDDEQIIVPNEITNIISNKVTISSNLPNSEAEQDGEIFISELINPERAIAYISATENNVKIWKRLNNSVVYSQTNPTIIADHFGQIYINSSNWSVFISSLNENNQLEWIKLTQSDKINSSHELLTLNLLLPPINLNSH